MKHNTVMAAGGSGYSQPTRLFYRRERDDESDDNNSDDAPSQ